MLQVLIYCKRPFVWIVLLNYMITVVALPPGLFSRCSIGHKQLLPLLPLCVVLRFLNSSLQLSSSTPQLFNSPLQLSSSTLQLFSSTPQLFSSTPQFFSSTLLFKKKRVGGADLSSCLLFSCSLALVEMPFLTSPTQPPFPPLHPSPSAGGSL